MKQLIEGVEVPGIVITSRLIERLKDYQLKENFGVNNGVDRDRGIIKNAICFLASMYDELDEDLFMSAAKLMTELNRVQENLEDLNYIYEDHHDDEKLLLTINQQSKTK